MLSIDNYIRIVLATVYTYTPTKDKINQQLNFLSVLKNYLNNFSNNVILERHFNVSLVVEIDERVVRKEPRSAYATAVADSMDESDFIDVQQLLNWENKLLSTDTFSNSLALNCSQMRNSPAISTKLGATMHTDSLDIIKCFHVTMVTTLYITVAKGQIYILNSVAMATFQLA